ncbi:hypothetical protein DH2020_044924 [Rehmannia glutinosa]|uniref:PB1 domain-containing protein n=1 Tax=Rehmannia glutinosa TaxID=99300 RepID=A0ABR0UFW4_REHGL
MSTDGAPIPTDIISTGSAPSSAPGSPKNRVKFLCSHGGKILPRPADGHLKYVGGETRVISVPRDIPFQELMKKLTYLIDGEMILKYQVVSEDLDALVSVKSDEDLRHMFDEIDRYENAGAPKLRAFLFPTNPVVMENQIGPVDPRALEQRYIDAINGIIRSTPNLIKQHPTINAMQHGSRVSSACTSPRSPDSCTTEAMNNEAMLQNNYFTFEQPICTRQNRGNGYMHYDECSHFFDRRMADRTGSLATSPVSSSPLGHGESLGYHSAWRHLNRLSGSLGRRLRC